MPRPSCLRLLLVFFCLALLPAPRALAQIAPPTRIQDVDPDEPDSQEQADEPEDESPSAEDSAASAKKHAGQDAKHAKDSKDGKDPKDGKETQDAKAATAEPAPGSAPTTDEPAAPAVPKLPPLLVPKVSNADLLGLWKQWQQAQGAKDTVAANAALKELLQRKEQAEASDLEPFSLSLLRAAEERRQAHDEGRAMQLTEEAVALAPNLPYAHLAYAEALARRDVAEVGRYLGEVKLALMAVAKDPRYLRPALADVGAMGLFALLMTAVVVVGVLFVRRVRYVLHDFHHFFPRAVDRWQAALLALLLFSAPAVLGLGLAPSLLVLLGAVAVYLTVAERAVAWGLLALVGLAPLAAGSLARATSFSGSVAEDVHLLEHGGLSADEASARVLARHQDKSAGFAELHALARFEARRGQLSEAVAHYRVASGLRSGDARLLTNWGNALLASGDVDGAAQLYTDAGKADATLAPPFYNLAMVLRRKAKTVPDVAVSGVLNRAREAMGTAQELDASLLTREPPPDDALWVNKLVLPLPLPPSELKALDAGEVEGERVEAQLSRALVAGLTGPVAWALPGVLGGVLFGWGFLRQGLKASRVCEKCGRPACRRCDPELGMGSLMCTQCVNVFARKGQVPAQMRARKEAQVAQHRTWMDRVALGFSALTAGAGHVFAGLPLRGALYAFLFLFGVGGVVFHHGVLRAPYGEAPTFLKLTLAGVLLLPVYLLTLRGLYKRQNG